VKDYSE
jgi:hypothetical protein